MSIHHQHNILIALEDNTISQGIQDALNHMAPPSTILQRTYGDKTSFSKMLNDSNQVQKTIIGINLELSSISSSKEIKQITCVNSTIDSFYKDFYHKINLVGYQRHFIPTQILQGLEINGRSNISLGLLTHDMNASEQIFRQSDYIECNLNALKGNEFPSFKYGNPAGLTSEQFIQLSKYAGYSDCVKILNFKFSKNQLTGNENFIANLIATSIWYFEESLIQSLHDHEDELIMSVVEHEHDFIYFYKSPNTGKCYFSYEEKDRKHSCSSQEYENALSNGEISDRIVRKILA